jgi:hypothetical protein
MDRMTIRVVVNAYQQNLPNEIAHLTIDDDEIASNGRTVAELLNEFKGQGWLVEHSSVSPRGNTARVTYELTRA